MMLQIIFFGILLFHFHLHLRCFGLVVGLVNLEITGCDFPFLLLICLFDTFGAFLQKSAIIGKAVGEPLLLGFGLGCGVGGRGHGLGGGGWSVGGLFI